MYGHIKGILCRGIRRRQQQKALSKAQFEKNESAKKAQRERIARETGAASSSSSQSRAPCPRPDADAVSVPVSFPDDDPMQAFHDSRPGDAKHAVLKAANLASRKGLRTETSDDEELDVREFCTGCG